MPLHHHFVSRSIFSFLFLLSINSGLTQAQITPDGTIPTSVRKLQNTLKITDGDRIGDNLFHSFKDFSIPTGMGASFDNAIDIQNIFARITGGKSSSIDGFLRTQGVANLFLINPDGIIFGENTQLNIGGSFIATTADEIKFADGTSFAARNPKIELTISVPIGLGLYGNNGSITVDGTGNQITRSSTFSPIEFSQRPTGLSVKNTQTLALVGNRLDFNSGVISTKGGNVYLTSIESGSVEINQSENGITLFDNGVTNYQDINLNQQSLINSSGERVGTISLIGKNINIKDGSFILAQNPNDSPSSSINIIASEALTLSDDFINDRIFSTIRSEVPRTGTNNGADLNISANQLIVRDFSIIQAATFSEDLNGLGGNINIDIDTKVQLINSGIITTSSAGKASSGGINLSSSELEILNNSVFSSVVSITSTADGGDVLINADLIKIKGEDPGKTALSASTISNSENNPGNAGNLTINTKRLKIGDIGFISTSSLGNGNAGNITINALESIEINGQNKNSQSEIRSSVRLVSPNDQQFLGLPSSISGNAGNIIINTPLLNLDQAAFINTENQGLGSAGTLKIKAETINLNQAGKITAAAKSGLGGNIELNTQNLNITNDSQITASAGGNESGGNITINTTNLSAKQNNQITASAFEGEGGNIKINATNSLSLNDQDSISAESEAGLGGNITLNTEQLQIKNNSLISTSAKGEGNGGNITINSNIFTALNSSEVRANAFEGKGGNIKIASDGFFLSPDSTISATSELGIDGTVTIETLSSDLEKELQQSEPKITDLSVAIAKTCLANQKSTGNLTVGGTGGLPFSPDSQYRNLDFTLTGVGFLREITNEESQSIKQNPSFSKEESLIPATQMIRTEDGEIYLIASLQEAKDLICLKE